jgi:hypothetical protein
MYKPNTLHYDRQNSNAMLERKGNMDPLLNISPDRAQLASTIALLDEKLADLKGYVDHRLSLSASVSNIIY